MIYDIVNFSDPCCVVADDARVATVACWMLSPLYAVMDVNGNHVASMHLDEDWPTLNGGVESAEQLQSLLRDPVFMQRVATCLDSVMCCHAQERESILAEAPEMDVRAYNEETRSSLNDLAGAAYELAERIRRNPVAPAEPTGGEG